MSQGHDAPDAGVPAMMGYSPIEVVSCQPFVVRRTVRWGECDPAGVVYTGRFADFVLDAVQLFFAGLADGNYHQWVERLGVDTPCKGMEFTFHHALWPGDVFEMTCTVPAVREHGYDISVEARSPSGTPIFSARFSPICIGRDVRKRAPIPPAMLEALAPHRRG
jgi:acyl-CoA thioesterase FadM